MVVTLIIHRDLFCRLSSFFKRRGSAISSLLLSWLLIKSGSLLSSLFVKYLCTSKLVCFMIYYTVNKQRLINQTIHQYSFYVNQCLITFDFNTNLKRGRTPHCIMDGIEPTSNSLDSKTRRTYPSGLSITYTFIDVPT